MTKANVLMHLKGRARTFHVEDLFVFTVEEWMNTPGEVLERLRAAVKSPKVIVRSSAMNEDSEAASMAGQFCSVLDVDTGNGEELSEAINKVVDSYAGKSESSENQILVQTQTRDISSSGVVFTWELSTNAPYYIICYDDESGRTDTITSGLNNKMAAVSRFVDEPCNPKWSGLLRAVREIENMFPGTPLDIEFAINKRGEVIIFQSRPIAANEPPDEQKAALARNLIEDMKRKFQRFSKRVPHLCGDRTIFTDMSDWNPSEIIGDRPNTLDYTLYRHLITDNIWHEARRELGYADVYPGELMTSFGRKPYIDTRLSFNSMVPATIPLEIREKLINYYLRKLQDNPELQDKVEFDILFACYDFTMDSRLEELNAHGFSADEAALIKRELKDFTVKVIKDSASIFDQDIKSTETLSHRRKLSLDGLDETSSLWDILSCVHYIANNCRRFGTKPFSRLARIAFIANTLLLSLFFNDTATTEIYTTLMLSVETVAKQFSYDFEQLSNENMSHEDFIQKYGHLRAGTYDITSARYDQQTSLLRAERSGQGKGTSVKPGTVEPSPATKVAINKALADNNLDIEAGELIEFIILALEYRELSKFEFTKSLSDILELIARAGQLLGLQRDEICHADFMLLMRYRNPEVSDIAYVKKRIKSSIDRHSSEKVWYSHVILPSVISSVNDFDCIEYHSSKPNFITDLKARGKTVLIGRSSLSDGVDISGKIVLIENADPGFDWIFTKKPAGLITKYGGVASHMAIRCAEFGLPAIIGCGEVIFKNMANSPEVMYDCMNNKIEYIK
jgi:phosphohistidine swiveling domain-containing protein